MKGKICMLGSRHSALYNLTPVMRDNVKGIQLSVGDFYVKRKVLKNLPEGWSFKRFCGYPEEIKTYLSPYDFHRMGRIKEHTNPKIVKILCDNGYVQFDSCLYDELSTIINPDYLVALTDYPESPENSILINRAMSKTCSYLSRSSLLQDEQRKTKILVPLHVSKDMVLTLTNLQKILMFDKIDGLVLCQLQEGWEGEERSRMLGQIGKLIGESKKKYMVSLGGTGKFSNIKSLQSSLNHDIDIIEVSYPFLLAQSHKALISTPLPFSSKSPQLLSELSPLDPTCSCYSCTSHNQAYISHLVSCNEPNAKILLSIHNLHAYMKMIDISE